VRRHPTIRHATLTAADAAGFDRGSDRMFARVSRFAERGDATSLNDKKRSEFTHRAGARLSRPVGTDTAPRKWLT
jgi:hypothetical protein